MRKGHDIEVMEKLNKILNGNTNNSTITSFSRFLKFWGTALFMKKPVPLPLPAFNKQDNKKKRPGIIMLGMHRSGTSMFTGILSQLGYDIGRPLLPPVKNDNPKGYFELQDVVYQNEEFFKLQEVSYHNPILYNPRKSLEQLRDKQMRFKHGYS